jgi:tellurite resistance protein
MDDAIREFRSQLSQALRGPEAKSFRYAEFVQQSGVAREVADQAAMSLFGQICVAAAEDGVITQPEQKRILTAARVLEISQEQAIAVVRQARQTVYRQQLKAAQADGEVTADEEAALAQLRESLGIAVAPAAAPAPTGEESASVEVTAGGDFSLSEEEFAESLQYRVRSTADRVLADIKFLKQFDAIQQSRAASWKKKRNYGLVGGLAGGILILIGANVATALAALGVVVLIVGFGWTIFASVQASSSAKLDLENRRYGLLDGVVRLVAADVGGDTPLGVSLDFRDETHADKLQRKGKVGRWDAEFYVDRWLDLQGRFVDGTKFSVAMIEKHQKRHRTKRSRSGKIKHKNKTKHATEAIVSLKIKGKRYPQLTGQAKQVDKYIQLPPKATLKSIRVEGEQLVLRSTCTVPWSLKSMGEPEFAERVRGGPGLDGVNWLAMMLLSLYALLNESK